MSVEIERKFLVTNSSWQPTATQKHRIIQGYLSTDPARSVRVRIKDQLAFLTIKGATQGISRQEFEYSIPLNEAESILALCAVSHIEKTRFIVPAHGKTWEIDVFTGANTGLILAELELNHPNESFTKPKWVGKEVTEDKRYYNLALAHNPYSNW